MQAGKRPISPQTVGLLCDVLELDGAEAQRLAAEAIITCAKQERRGVLRRAFFGLLGRGAKSGGAALPTTDAPETNADAGSQSIHCRHQTAPAKNAARQARSVAGWLLKHLYTRCETSTRERSDHEKFASPPMALEA